MIRKPNYTKKSIKLQNKGGVGYRLTDKSKAFRVLSLLLSC